MAIPRDEHRILGVVIARLRDDRRISQHELAAKVRRRQPAIAKTELGMQTTDVAQFLDFAHALGVTGVELFTLFEGALAEDQL